METRVNRTELAKAGIFLSVLMVFFGFGSYVAETELFAGDPRFDQHAVARQAITWFLVGVSGLLLLVFSIVQFRKSRNMQNS